MRRNKFIVAGALLGVLLTTGVAHGQDVQVLPVRGNVYMIVAGSSNIAVSVGADGALLVDSGSAAASDKVLAAVKQLLTAVGASTSPVRSCVGCAGLVSPLLHEITASPAPPKPIRYVINTNALPDHTGGNTKIAEAGKTITGGDIVSEILGSDATDVATVVAHENVLIRLSEPDSGVAANGLPAEVYSHDIYKLSHFFNGEGVQAIYQPSAITDGDSIVYFRYSDVVVAGDIFVTTSYPMIDLKKGGSIQGVIDGVNKILDLSVTETRAQGGTMIIPGHGRLCDSSDVAYYRDMVTIIRDRVQAMIGKGMTLAQVKAARPSLDYDTRYATSSWTADMFIEAVYSSLKSQ